LVSLLSWLVLFSDIYLSSSLACPESQILLDVCHRCMVKCSIIFFLTRNTLHLENTDIHMNHFSPFVIPKILKTNITLPVEECHLLGYDTMWRL
jgi:hypothetical protein